MDTIPQEAIDSETLTDAYRRYRAFQNKELDELSRERLIDEIVRYRLMADFNITCIQESNRICIGVGPKDEEGVVKFILTWHDANGK